MSFIFPFTILIYPGLLKLSVSNSSKNYSYCVWKEIDPLCQNLTHDQILCLNNSNFERSLVYSILVVKRKLDKKIYKRERRKKLVFLLGGRREGEKGRIWNFGWTDNVWVFLT